MIIARKIQLEEVVVSKKILQQYDINDENEDRDINYVLIIDDKIVGVCKVNFNYDIGILKYIVIDKEQIGQDLGDALLRSTLNYCFRNGISKVYYKTINEYLIKKGFEKNKRSFRNLKSKEDEEYLLEINLESFFSRPCKSSQK